MSRQQGQSSENNFIRGLITETTALRFPENACTETFNCVYDFTGRVTRRLPFNYEVNYTTQTVPRAASSTTSEVFTEFLWRGAGGNGDKNFLVQQVGGILYFYDVSSSVTVSQGLESFTVTLLSYAVSGSTNQPRFNICQYASGNGQLIVTSKAINPIVVTYSSVSDTISVKLVQIKERDFSGLTDNLDLTERPSYSLTTVLTGNPEHLYNIVNQGWHNAASLQQWDAGRSDLPSNADIPSVYRVDDTDGFDNNIANSFVGSNTSAPKGHFILEAFAPDRNAEMTAIGYTVSLTVPADQDQTTKERPQSCAFFAGRAWYAGIDAPIVSNKVYFSHVIQSNDDYERCYQYNDPTDENFNDLLADDGGYVKILEAASIKKIFAFRSALVVFAINGVWLITGGTGGFTANDVSVKKISGIGTTSPLSFVDVGGTPMWWGENGIYTIEYEPNYDSYKVVPLTSTTIASFVDAIPVANRQFIKGCYNIDDLTVQWLYRSQAITNVNQNYVYDGVLNLSTVTKAFYPWSIETGSVHQVRGICYVDDAQGLSSPLTKYTVSTVVDSSNQTLSYGDLHNGSSPFLDWSTEDYSSYGITGWKIDGGGTRNFQNLYSFFFFDQEENSSCFIRAYWDFSNSGSSGKWSNSNQVYQTNRLYRDVNYRRTKVRGKGKALQFKFFSETGKPFSLIGWSLVQDVPTNV